MSFLNRILPTAKVSKDPACVQCAVEGIEPITLESLKLLSSVRAAIDSNRQRGIEVTFEQPNKLGIVVPYRNRKAHLERFMPHMHSYLDRLGVSHVLIIAEQADELPFNRGAMMNVGMVGGWEDCDYFCCHDVDLLPDNAEYRGCSQPLRLLDQNIDPDGKAYRHFNHYFGGVTAISRKLAEQINGFSNRYWGWGLEDDNFLLRCLFAGLHPCKDTKGLFRELPHPPSIGLNISGKEATPAELRANRQRLRDGKRFHSSIKRRLRDPFDEGIDRIHPLSMEVTNEERVRWVRTSLASIV